MNNLVKHLDELATSDALADLPEVSDQLTAARDQLDVAAIALYTEIEAVTKQEREQDGLEANVTRRPDLRVVTGGAGQAPPAGEDQISDERSGPGQLVVASESRRQEVKQVETGPFPVSLPPISEPAVRRFIKIPEAIAEDPDAVARFVVEAPNVVLLVDGDAAAGLGWPSFPLTDQRSALITYLAELSTKSGCSPDVVLDGRLGPEGTTHASKGVRLRLTKAPTAPIQALDELIDAYPTKWSIAVVTDDQDLVSSATIRNATVLTNRQLLNLFNPI